MHSRHRSIPYAPLLSLLSIALFSASAPAVTLVNDGKPEATIILPIDATPHTEIALEELRDYIRKTSGAELPFTRDPGSVTTANRIWLGLRPELAERFPGLDLALHQPEETLIAAGDSDLVIAGRDKMHGKRQLEAGTQLATYQFLEDHLGVRWLWPGALGEDILPKHTISFSPFTKRFAPQIQTRRLRMISPQRDHRTVLKLRPDVQGLQQIFEQHDRAIADWANRQRIDAGPIMQASSPLRGSFRFEGGHAFGNWWNRFHKKHPDYFALQADGTRSGYPGPRFAKMCVSHPLVAEEWLKEAVQKYNTQPWNNVIQAAENDMGWQGYCRCEECKTLDAKNGPILSSRLKWEGLEERHYSLTDRYVHFWNRLAQGLKKQLPEASVHVGVFAYQANALPPVAIELEENVAVGFVGFFERNPGVNTLAAIEKEKDYWRRWSEKASRLVWRPNMMIHRFHLGMPYLFPRKTAHVFQFTADHKIVGIDIDNFSNDWATQGPQYYVTAQLAWNPRADVEELLRDYYQRGFGPAADHVAAYYDFFEKIYAEYTEANPNWHFPRLPEFYRQYDALAKANASLAKAEKSLTGAPDIYRERLEFVKTGLEFARRQIEALEALEAWQNASGETRTRLETRLQKAIKQRENLYRENLRSPALGYFKFILTDVVRELSPTSKTNPDATGQVEKVPDDQG